MDENFNIGAFRWKISKSENLPNLPIFRGPVVRGLKKLRFLLQKTLHDSTLI